jgi:hypothetical protein
MPPVSQPVIGTIRIKSAAATRRRGGDGDSTLEMLLTSLGRFLVDDDVANAADGSLPARRFSVSLASADAVVRANVSQLLDDLQQEYDRLSAISP